MNFYFRYNTSEIGTLTGMIVGVALFGILFYLYLKNLSDLLKAVREHNRRIKPSSVWLLYLSVLNSLLTIPVFLFAYDYPSLIIVIRILSYAVSLFMVIWYFKIVKGIATSIEAEFDSRSIPIEYRPSYQTGMFMTISLATTLVKEIPYIGFLGSIAILTYVIGWIAYWVRTYKFKKELQALSQHQDEESLIFNDLN
jgi:uncharacterized membrane protein